MKLVLQIISIQIVVVLFLPNLVLSQETTQSDTTKQSGTFGGPSSVSGQINRDEQQKSDFMQSYFDFKKQLKKTVGLLTES